MINGSKRNGKTDKRQVMNDKVSGKSKYKSFANRKQQVLRRSLAARSSPNEKHTFRVVLHNPKEKHKNKMTKKLPKLSGKTPGCVTASKSATENVAGAGSFVPNGDVKASSNAMHRRANLSSSPMTEQQQQAKQNSSVLNTEKLKTLLNKVSLLPEISPKKPSDHPSASSASPGVVDTAKLKRLLGEVSLLASTPAKIPKLAKSSSIGETAKKSIRRARSQQKAATDRKLSSFDAQNRIKRPIKKSVRKTAGSDESVVDKAKLKRLLEGVGTTVPKTETSPEFSLDPSSSKTKVAKIPSLRERMVERLNAARFRYINENLYSSTGEEAQKFFKDDPNAFADYHQGYDGQASKWPVSPVDVIIEEVKKLPINAIIADLGCGNAKLAKSVPHKVYSFDLVALNENVVACNMANVPLINGGVDVAVLCLSLMGTNLVDYLLEANRILKVGGLLKIAEIESRFDDVKKFTAEIGKMGFTLINRNENHKMFIFLNFRKIRHCKEAKNVKIILHPCLYKKR